MPVLLSLALRNLKRHRARTAISLAAILFGAMAGTLMGGFISAFQRTLAEQVVRGRLGALQVHRAGYLDNRAADPLDLDLEQGGELERKIRAVPGVEAVAPRLAFNALANNGSAAAMAAAVGVDPEAEQAVLPLALDTVRGRWVGAGGPQSVVLGTGLAQALGLAPGAGWVLQASTRDGRQNALDVDLGGTDDVANIWESGLKALVPLETAQRLLRMPGRATSYAISISPKADPDEVARALRASLGADYDVRTWRELAPYVSDIFLLQRVIFGLALAVFLVVAVIGTMNTMLMSVLERTREIGMMMAAGMRRRWITGMFLLEAVALAFLGGLAGMGLGMAVLAGARARGGLRFVFPGGTRPMAVVPQVPVRLAAIVVAVLFLGAIAAAAWPALRAARLRPAEALRDA